MQRWKRKDGNTVEGAIPEVEAVQLTAENIAEVAEWCQGKPVVEKDAFDSSKVYAALNVPSWVTTRASEGDYIIKDGLGTFHVRWPESFEGDFEKMEE